MSKINQKIFDRNQDFVGAKGLVFVGERILTYKRDGQGTFHPNGIDLPGGGREGGESPFETFHREVAEEFGLEINKEDVVWGKPFRSVVDPEKVGWFLVAKTSVENESMIVFGNEGVGYSLMTLAEFLKRKDAHPVHQERARVYLTDQAK